MAGLCAAARARELGADVTVFEKGDRPGGSMLLSSGMVWRHRRFEDFRAECPAGDEALQRLIYDRLDDGLDYARDRGAAATAGMDEFYGRALPDAPVEEQDFVRLSQVYGRYATVVDERGEPFFSGPVSWSENDLVQAIAGLHGGRAWYL